MNNEAVNYYQKYNGVYYTRVENETIIPIVINDTTYRHGLDILNVFVNGKKVSVDKHTVDEKSIILQGELHAVGTKVEFEVLRSVVTSLPFETLKGDVGNVTILKKWRKK